MSASIKTPKVVHSKSKSILKQQKSQKTHKNCDSSDSLSSYPTKPQSVTVQMDLKKEYYRYCKLYSSEPLEFVAAPLEQATLCQGAQPGVGGVSIDLKGRGLRGVDCVALGKILGSNASIHHLNLSDCLLLPQGFQAVLDGVSKNTNLETLELRGNNIQFANMLDPMGAMLKVNSNLKRLVLEWNQIGSQKDAFQTLCEGISINSGLEYLDLRNNQVSDECAIQLAGSLQHNKTIQDIDLRWNSIGVKGARAFYDLLNINTTITQIQLGGNFVPEEIVQHIEQLLLQRSQQGALVKDYSTRTTILTRQLQKTEEEYQNEIKNIMSVFDAEEKDYRRLLEENQNHINRLSQERQEEVDKNAGYQAEIRDLKKQIEEAQSEEAKLTKQITKKDTRLAELENSFKSQTGTLESNFEEKIIELQKSSDTISQEKVSLLTKLRTTEAELSVKIGEIAQLKDTVAAVQKTSDELQQQFDNRLRQAKESWAGFQTEVESAERKEIQRLEIQMTEMNSSLMDHLKILENKKADAEEEVRRLKIILVTSKSETEEELAKLRVVLAEEHNASMKNYVDQTSNLRQENEKLELAIAQIENQHHKLEVENGKLMRQTEHLKQQLSQANEDLSEVHASTQTTMTRTRNELKEATERLIKEEESNRTLRTKTHEFQQQIATLSVKVTKLSQEKQADKEFWQVQIQRREDELNRLKSEDMRRASLLHEAFSVYMRSTAAATGLPVPSLPSPLFCSEPKCQPENTTQLKENPTVEQ